MAMAERWEDLVESLRSLGANWTIYTAMGSLALYLVGYLSLRFHLTVLGVGTDIDVLDERYIFAGARFLINVVYSVPILLLLALGLITPIYLPYRLLPASIRGRIRGFVGRQWARIWAWWFAGNRLTLTGIIISLVMIQFVMRQCYFFSNLLLSQKPPDPKWLRDLLVDEAGAPSSLYFTGLVAGTVITGGFFLAARNIQSQPPFYRLLRGLLAFLVAAQLLLLPVNYGILIDNKMMPKVANLGGNRDLEKGQEAWLIWEGKEGMTYLIRNRGNGKEQRALLTLSRKDTKEIKITGYDRILWVLFGDQPKRTGLPQASEEDER
jgi:hypothetical protein